MRSNASAPVGRLIQRPLETVDPLVLGLLRGLPEKQVGDMVVPKIASSDREEVAAPSDTRHEEPQRGLAPGNLDDENGRNIGEATRSAI